MRNDAAVPPPLPPAAARRGAGAQVAAHARRLSAWQLWPLLAFLVVGVVGAGFYLTAGHEHPAARGVAAGVPPGGASGFLGASDTATTTADPATTGTDDSWSAWGGRHGAAVGFGFVGGFIIGFVFRAFLKLMTLLAVVVGGGLAALSYYHILNIDLTAAQHAYTTNAAWLTDQATRFKDVLIAHLPSSGSGAAGVFFGLRRR